MADVERGDEDGGNEAARPPSKFDTPGSNAKPVTSWAEALRIGKPKGENERGNAS